MCKAYCFIVISNLITLQEQKVQVADEIKRDIWKYLVSSDVANDV